MSITLNHEPTKTTPPRARHRRVPVDPSHVLMPDRRGPTPVVTDEEEAVMVAKYAIALAILGTIPLIVFLLIYYFFPNLLLFLDPPAN